MPQGTQQPPKYSPDNPFAPKGASSGYSPDNPFAPKPVEPLPDSTVVRLTEEAPTRDADLAPKVPELGPMSAPISPLGRLRTVAPDPTVAAASPPTKPTPASTGRAGGPGAGRPTLTGRGGGPGVAGEGAGPTVGEQLVTDLHQEPPIPQPRTKLGRAVAGAGEMAAGIVEHPIDSAEQMAEAPFKAAHTVMKAGANWWARMDALQEGRDPDKALPFPDVKLKDAIVAATQLGALHLSGPAGEYLRDVALRVRVPARIAHAIGGGAAGAGVGASFSPDDPASGALLGLGIGAAAGASAKRGAAPKAGEPPIGGDGTATGEPPIGPKSPTGGGAPPTEDAQAGKERAIAFSGEINTAVETDRAAAIAKYGEQRVKMAQWAADNAHLPPEEFSAGLTKAAEKAVWDSVRSVTRPTEVRPKELPADGGKADVAALLAELKKLNEHLDNATGKAPATEARTGPRPPEPDWDAQRKADILHAATMVRMVADKYPVAAARLPWAEHMLRRADLPPIEFFKAHNDFLAHTPVEGIEPAVVPQISTTDAAAAAAGRRSRLRRFAENEEEGRIARALASDAKQGNAAPAPVESAKAVPEYKTTPIGVELGSEPARGGVAVIEQPVRAYIPETSGMAATEEQLVTRNVARSLKTGAPEAIKHAAPEMATRVPPGAILVPLPDSQGNTAANVALAQAIAAQTGSDVFDALTRTAPTPSSMELRQKGKPGLTAEDHAQSLAVRPDADVGMLHSSRQPIVFIDNVETTGATAEAARRVIGRDGKLVVYAKAPVPAGEQAVTPSTDVAHETVRELGIDPRTLQMAEPSATYRGERNPINALARVAHTLETQTATARRIAKGQGRRRGADIANDVASLRDLQSETLARAGQLFGPEVQARLGQRFPLAPEVDTVQEGESREASSAAAPGSSTTAPVEGAAGAGGRPAHPSVAGHHAPAKEPSGGSRAGTGAPTQTREAERVAPRPPLKEIGGEQGREDRVRFAGGADAAVRYRAIEAEELQPSHHPTTFAKNPDYPAGIQGREYSGSRGTEARRHVELETGRLRPDILLDAGAGATEGPPVVTKHGIAIAGNQRAMMLQRALESAPERAAAYREELIARAPQFGLDPEKLKAMKNPVLVRQLMDEMDTEQMGRLNQLSDTPTTKAKDTLSAAAGRAAQLRSAHDALGHFNDTIGEDDSIRDYLDSSAGREFVKRLFSDAVFHPQERSALIVDDKPTEAAKQAIVDMLRLAAIGDADVIHRAPASMLRKLDSALPAIIRANASVRYSIQPYLRSALELLTRVDDRKSEMERLGTPTTGFGVDEYVAARQGDIFGTKAEDPDAVRTAQWLEREKKAAITEGLREYARVAVRAERESESGDVFGYEAETPAEARAKHVQESAPTSYGDVSAKDLEREADAIFHRKDAERFVRCTECADAIVNRFGGAVVGYWSDENPRAAIPGDLDEGHDIAIVAGGRFIVDPWAKNVADLVDRAVLDLTDHEDAREVRRRYGDASKWEVLRGGTAERDLLRLVQRALALPTPQEISRMMMNRLYRTGEPNPPHYTLSDDESREAGDRGGRAESVRPSHAPGSAPGGAEGRRVGDSGRGAEGSGAVRGSEAPSSATRPLRDELPGVDAGELTPQELYRRELLRRVHRDNTALERIGQLELIKEGKSISAIAREFGMAASSVRTALDTVDPDFGKRYAAVRDQWNRNRQEALALRQRGMTYKEIAAALNVTPSMAWARVNSTVRETDLFGYEAPKEKKAREAEDQTSMFGGGEGTEASRPLESAERAAQSELEKLKQRALLETSQEKSVEIAQRIALLTKLINRGNAITADELATEARARTNPFAERAATARAKADRLTKPTTHDEAMAQSFPLGGGYGRKGGEARLERSIDRAIDATRASKDANYLEAQRDKFERGEIDERGHAISPEGDARRAKRLESSSRRSERIAAAIALREGKERWQVPASVWADSTGNFGGGARALIIGEHREVVDNAIAAGKPVPADVLAEHEPLGGDAVGEGAPLPYTPTSDRPNFLAIEQQNAKAITGPEFERALAAANINRGVALIGLALYPDGRFTIGAPAGSATPASVRVRVLRTDTAFAAVIDGIEARGATPEARYLLRRAAEHRNELLKATFASVGNHQLPSGDALFTDQQSRQLHDETGIWNVRATRPTSVGEVPPAPFASRLYSRLERAIQKAPFEKGTVEQWKAALTKNVAASERDYTGIERFLSTVASGRVVTRVEVLTAYNAGRIALTEKQIGGDPPIGLRDPEDIDQAQFRMGEAREAHQRARERLARLLELERGWTAEQVGSLMSAIRQADEPPGADAVAAEHATRTASLGRWGELTADLAGPIDTLWHAQRELSAALNEYDRVSPGPPDHDERNDYEEYTEPGGTNYRIILVQLDRSRPELIGRWLKKEGDKTFYETHFSEPDVLVHVRLKDRVGPAGEKVLFVEEIQSQWHEKGRTEGYAPPANPTLEHAKEFFGITDESWNAHPEMRDSYLDELREHIATNFRNLDRGDRPAVPDAPFKKTDEWMGLAMKRVIDEAVRGGYDRISWTTGQQQIDRYDLSKHVDRIDYEPETGQLIAWRDTASGRQAVHQGRYDEKALPSVIGKELAQRLLSSPVLRRHAVEITTYQTISGIDLKVGGRGMRVFYDEMLPNWIRDYTKKVLGKAVAIESIGVTRRGSGLTAGDVRTLADGHDTGGGVVGELLRKIASRMMRTGETAMQAYIEEAKDYSRAIGETAQRVILDGLLPGRRDDTGERAENLSFVVTPELRAKVLVEGQMVLESSAQRYDPTQADLFQAPESAEAKRLDDEEAKTAFGSVAKKESALARHREALERFYPSAATRQRQIAAATKGRRFSVPDRQRILNPDDAARLAELTRDPKVERFNAYLLADSPGAIGEVVAHEITSSGALSFSAVDAVRMAENLARRARHLGVRRVLLSHNHPTGDTTVSDGDKAVTLVLARELSKRGLELVGHVVINHGEYSWLGPIDNVFTKPSGVIESHIRYKPRSGTMPTAVSEERMQVATPDHAMLLASMVAHPEATVLMWLDGQRRPVAIEARRQLRMETASRWIPEQMRALGAHSLIVVAPHSQANAAAEAANAAHAAAAVDRSPSLVVAGKVPTWANDILDILPVEPDGAVDPRHSYRLRGLLHARETTGPRSADYAKIDEPSRRLREGAASAYAEAGVPGRLRPSTEVRDASAQVGEASPPPYRDPEPTGLDREEPLRVRDVAPALALTFNPEGASVESRATAGAIRHERAVDYREIARARFALRELMRAIDALPLAEKVKLWDTSERWTQLSPAEREKRIPDPILREGVKLLHETTARFTAQLVSLNRLRADQLIEDYVGRFWHVPGRSVSFFLRRIRGRRPLEGPKSFLKHRTWEHFTDGLKAIQSAAAKVLAGDADDGDRWTAAIRPATYNVVESQLAKLKEMQRVIGATKMLRYEREMERARPVMLGGDVPLTEDGREWVKIDPNDKDPAFTIYGPREGAVTVPKEATVPDETASSDDLFGAARRRLKPSEVRVFGRRVIGSWYAHPESAPIWQAHLSRGMRGRPGVGPLYSAYMAVANASTQILLGFSGFHFATITREAINSRATLAALEMAEMGKGGSPKAALERAAEAAGGLASAGASVVATDLAFARRIAQEYHSPGTHPELAKVLDGMLKGGFRVTQASEFWTGERLEALKKDWRSAFEAEQAKALGLPRDARTAALAKIPWDIPWAIIETQMRPLMAYYVPMLKTAATYRAAEQRLGELPANASIDQERRAMASVVKDMDHRYGQAVYDNYFMHRIIKDVAQAYFLAPAWTFGWLEILRRGLGGPGLAGMIGGAVVAGPPGAFAGAAGGLATKIGARALKRLVGGGGGGKKPPGEPPEAGGDAAEPDVPDDAELERPLTEPEAFLASSFVILMIVNGLLTYFHTGEQPEGKDFFGYRDGTLDQFGNPNRHLLPGGEMRDFYSWVTHPIQTLGHKQKPLLGAAARVLQNRDYYGNLLYDPDLPLREKSIAIAKAAAKELGTPISWSNFQQARRQGTDAIGEIVRSGLGVGVKPEFQRTPAQNMMMEYLHRTPGKSLTPEQLEESNMRRDVLKQFQTGELSETDLEKMAERHEITQRQRSLMITRKRSELAYQFNRLSLEDAEKVAAEATLSSPESEASLFNRLLEAKRNRSDLRPRARLAPR